MVIAALLISTFVLAVSFNSIDNVEEVEPEPVIKQEAWIPTEEDIAYQDSMYAIIERTQQDVDTIKNAINGILYKLERLEYPNGTYDSVRYVKGGKIDKRRN